MKKVVCIKTKIGGMVQDQTGPQVEKGKIYTVVAIGIGPFGAGYNLLEMGNWCYSVKLFIDLIQDNQDETEMVRNYQTEKV